MVESRPLTFEIRGMDCAEEVAVLRRAMRPLVPRDEAITFDVLGGRMTILPPESFTIPSDAVLQAVARTGMKAELTTGDPHAGKSGSWWYRRGRALLTALSGVMSAAGFILHAVQSGNLAAALGSEGLGAGHGVFPPAAIFYGLGIVCGVWFVIPKAWAALRSLRPDMNLLMTIAVIGAVAIGEWFEAAAVSFLFALSLALEAWSIARARRSVEALMSVAPDRVRIRTSEGREEERRPSEVAVGALILVRPGERVPLDGQVERGASAVNQAPITGESVPVEKSAGDAVYAGTINGDGALEIRTTKGADDALIAHIIRMVIEAQGKRAPAELWVDTFARIYTPVVIVAAFAMLLIPPLLFGAPWSAWIYRSLVLLVIACPCALVISTPVSIVAALTAAARAGVLVKGGAHLEAAARIKTVALDKTGTLTEGRPSVVAVEPLGGHVARELLSIAAAMESHSDHPLARAVMDHVKQERVTFKPAQEFQIVQGKGATALVEGKRYWLGSHRYLEEWGQETPEVHEKLEAMSSSGRSIVVVGDGAHVCGFIGLADRVRPASRATIEALRAAGVERVVMLTGDNRGTAESIAREVGVDDVRAELLPEDKVKAIEDLVAGGRAVAMVGDGINDAPALARATLGIAMGAAGSDAAIETADVALMSDDLAKAPWLIHHARRTLAVVRQNIVFSLAVKAVFVALTIAGAASLWAAIAADMGASLLVIVNGLRLLGSPRASSRI